MKGQGIYYILGTLLVLAVIGYFAGWFKNISPASSTTGTSGSKRVDELFPSSPAASSDPVVIPTNQLDCAKISGLSGTLQLDGHQIYCSGTFQCTPDGKITCQNPTYYYYPYYYTYGFPFFRGGRHGHHH